MNIVKSLLFSFLIMSLSYAGGFDDLGYSARSVGMGGAGIAVHGAPYSLFYNPANIYSAKNLSFYTTYSNLFPGVQDDKITYVTASGIVPVSFLGTLGTGLTFLHSDFWKEYTLSAAYAKEIFDGFTVGGSFKYMGWSAAAAEGESALSYNGFTFDAGISYTLHELLNNTDLTFAASVQNITEPSIASSGSPEGSELPRKIGLGFAFKSLQYNYLITSDIIKENDQYWSKSGAEFSAYKGELFTIPVEVWARVGYYQIVKSDFAEANGLNGGFGIKVDDYTFDYAYNYPHLMEDIGGSHKLSFSFNF